MSPREFSYVGNPVSKIQIQENRDFIMLLQKSMLLSLVKRNLLTSAQVDCVMEKLEKQYSIS